MSELASTPERQCAPQRRQTPPPWEENWRVRTELRELTRNHQNLTRELATVVADRDRLRERGAALAAEHGEPQRWEAAIQGHPDPYEVLWHKGPFAGFTVAKAEVLQDALEGYEVLVQGSHSEKRGIFQRILLPGDRVSTPFDALYDLEIATSWIGCKCSSSSAWNCGIGAVQRFEVIGPEYGFCEDCCLWVPKGDLMDRADIADEGTIVHRICCRHMDFDGACL